MKNQENKINLYENMFNNAEDLRKFVDEFEDKDENLEFETVQLIKNYEEVIKLVESLENLNVQLLDESIDMTNEFKELVRCLDDLSNHDESIDKLNKVLEILYDENKQRQRNKVCLALIKNICLEGKAQRKDRGNDR